MRSSGLRRIVRGLSVAGIAGIAGVIAIGISAPAHAEVGPQLSVNSLVSGLNIPWDVTFAPDGTMFFDERFGALKARLVDGTVKTLSADMGDVFAVGESGVMGLAVDPGFSQNREIYSCQGYVGQEGQDVRVIKWTVDAAYSKATRSRVLVKGIQNTGRHSGCRLRFDQNGLLFVATGDAAVGTTPQDLGSLNGKVLRMTSDGGVAPGNPFAGSSNPVTRLIYTYGHRNVQGLSLRPGTNEMWSVEQGTDRDDEVNRLLPGRNYGYDPIPGYNESVPMTDLKKYPTAVPAVYSTGYPTLALSGGGWLSGPQWGSLDGVFVAAALKGARLVGLRIDAQSTVRDTVDLPELSTGYGRLRAPLQGPDGALYITTSNGPTNGGDRILRVSVKGTPGDPLCRDGSPVADSPIGSVITKDNQLFTVVVGLDRAVWYRNADTGGWASLGGIGSYGPSVVSADASNLDIFVVGYDGILNHGRLSGAGQWSGWERLGGILTASPIAVTYANGVISVYGRGTDRSLWSLTKSSSGWSSWVRVGGLLSAAPGGAVDPDAQQGEIGVRGEDGRAFRLRVSAQGPVGGFAEMGFSTCSALGYSARAGDGQSFVFGYVGYQGRPAIVDGSVRPLGGNLSGSLSVATSGNAGFAAIGRGLDGAVWIYDARSNTGAWRSIGGLVR